MISPALKRHGLFLVLWGMAVAAAPLVGVLAGEPAILRIIVIVSGSVLVLGGVGVLYRNRVARYLCLVWGGASILVFVLAKTLLGSRMTGAETAVAVSWALSWSILEYWKLFTGSLARAFGSDTPTSPDRS